MTVDVLTAIDLNRSMTEKSHEVDEAVTELKRQSMAHAIAIHAAEKAKALARPGVKKNLGPKPTVDDINAAVYLMCSDTIFEELRSGALEHGADRALRAYMAQLSALQSQATALREELRLARVGPDYGP
jgi:hypothetical protein